MQVSIWLLTKRYVSLINESNKKACVFAHGASRFGALRRSPDLLTQKPHCD